MATELLLGSQNPGKLQEMRHLVAGLPLRVMGPLELGLTEAPEETGSSFLENARLKALYYSRRSGRLAAADDSGICVDALGGEPGLYSSRFGGEDASDHDRNRLMLARLSGVPDADRGAHFFCTVVVARGEEILFETQQAVDGLIAREMRGGNGFGYDPLFFYPPFGRTFGEVAREEKDRVSHRGKAFARLREFLATLA
jgi:XTP/dITP diphosphohydrolase